MATSPSTTPMRIGIPEPAGPWRGRRHRPQAPPGTATALRVPAGVARRAPRDGPTGARRVRARPRGRPIGVGIHDDEVATTPGATRHSDRRRTRPGPWRKAPAYSPGGENRKSAAREVGRRLAGSKRLASRAKDIMESRIRVSSATPTRPSFPTATKSETSELNRSTGVKARPGLSPPLFCRRSSGRSASAAGNRTSTLGDAGRRGFPATRLIQEPPDRTMTATSPSGG